MQFENEDGVLVNCTDRQDYSILRTKYEEFYTEQVTKIK